MNLGQSANNLTKAINNAALAGIISMQTHTPQEAQSLSQVVLVKHPSQEVKPGKSIFMQSVILVDSQKSKDTNREPQALLENPAISEEHNTTQVTFKMFFLSFKTPLNTSTENNEENAQPDEQKAFTQLEQYSLSRSSFKILAILT